MALAQGGQILLTAEAHQALGETRLQAQSHGHWIMKGLAEPVELFEVGGRARCAFRRADRQATRPTASCATATAGFRSGRSRTTCRSR